MRRDANKEERAFIFSLMLPHCRRRDGGIILVCNALSEKPCRKWEIVSFATSQLLKSHFSLPPEILKACSLLGERQTTSYRCYWNCVIMQKITCGKRKFGSYMKYFNHLGVQSSDACLQKHIVILPVNNSPWINAQNGRLPSLWCMF